MLQLLEEFSSMVTTLTNLPNLTFEGVESSLFEEDKKLKNGQQSSTSERETTFLNKFNVKCNHCGRTREELLVQGDTTIKYYGGVGLSK